MDWSSILIMILETLGMTVISAIIAYLFGIPAGVLLNVTSKNGLKPNKIIHFTLGLIVNILRSIPCLILLVICMPWIRAWFGRGTGAWYTMLIPLSVATFGFVARMVEQSLAEVPAGELEAIRSLGASNWQLVYKVLLPEAKVSLISGVAVSLVSILGYTSFAYNISAGGLIAGIWSYYTKHTGDYAASIVFWLLIVIVIVIVQFLQEIGLFISKKLDKRRILR